MEGIVHVDALVVGARSVVFHWIGAIKHHVASLGPGPKRLQQRAEAHALPFADRAPAFDAIVARDLGAAGQRAQLGKREARRLLDQTA